MDSSLIWISECDAAKASYSEKKIKSSTLSLEFTANCINRKLEIGWENHQ